MKIRKIKDIEIKKFQSIFKDAPKKNLEKFNFYGAYDNDKLIGGIVIKIDHDNFHYKRLDLFPEILIEFFFVLKEYRNKGIGKELFSIALKYKSIGLRTGGMTTNIAKNFYKKLGFRIVKEMKGLTKYWYYEKD